jgi:hypothetical protein
MHDAHLALNESVLFLPHGEDHGHVLDESSLRLSRLHLTVCCAAMHRDRSCVHRCDTELHQPCAELQSAELLDDHHRGTNDRNLDDHDPLADDPLNHHGYKTNDHCDLMADDHDLDDHDLDDHYLDDHCLMAGDPLNHRG